MRLMNQSLMGGIQFCKQCGARILLQGYQQNRITHIMKKKHICYECAYWNNILMYPPKHLEVMGNKCIKILPVVERKDKTMILGGRGKMRYFMRPDMKLFKSNDVWVIGTIPERFRDKFKTTAIEITQKAFNKLTTNPKKCIARACMDRYGCWRFNLELEREHGPYNVVPPTWKIGNEKCRSFIGFDEILS